MYHTDPASVYPNIDSEGKSFRTWCLIAFALEGTGPRGQFFWDQCLIFRCCKVRSCARAIELAKIDKSMTRFQGLPVGKLEHHDSYCCCSWDWLGEKVIHVAKSISPSRSWDDVAAQWVPVDLPLQGLLHASEKAWHRNYAHSSSSVGNALRFQSWAQCVWMLLTFHNWSRIYHCRDGRTFFWSFKWKQIAAFCRVQSAATQIQMPYFVWCRDSGVKVCKGCQGWTPS